MEESTEVSCPSCGEVIELWLDLSVEQQTYVEDCSVCCCPMQVSYTSEAGELLSISVEAI